MRSAWLLLLATLAMSGAAGDPGTEAARPRPVAAAGGAALAAEPGAARARWRPLTEPFVAATLRVHEHTPCVISTRGEVACWGRLEDASATTPLALRGGASRPHVLIGVYGAIDVAAAGPYVCVAQREDIGGGLCLARGEYARERPAPAFPSPAVELAATRSRVCARMRDGRVGCIDSSGAYADEPTIAEARRLACAHEGCCAATPSGVRCFGASPPVPADIPAATALALDDRGGCARTATGGARCWGSAASLSRASGVRDVARGPDGATCVLDPDGAVACTGDRVEWPPEIAALDGSCVLQARGHVRCTGDNSDGQLGDGGLLGAVEPVPVPGLSGAVALNVGHSEACARRADGTLVCWGPTPTELGPAGGPFVAAQYHAGCRVAGQEIRCDLRGPDGRWARDVVAVPWEAFRSAAIHRGGTICVADAAGAVRCRYGVSERGAVVERWVTLAAPAPVVELQPLATGLCARHDDGRVSCFVDYRYDAVDGSPDELPRGKLTLVPGVERAAHLAAGNRGGCVITTDARVLCFQAEPGAGHEARELPTLRGATALGTNAGHSCAVVRGAVWCWGGGFLGQLGDGVPMSFLGAARTPVRVKGVFRAIAVGVGGYTSCALDDGGQVWCWGSNERGALGHSRRLRSEGWSEVVGLGAE
jgi:hypothetical protein